LNFNKFARVLYQKAPNVKHMYPFEAYASHFSKYILQIPVYGAIILNST
jgi:hypothetical protein